MIMIKCHLIKINYKTVGEKKKKKRGSFDIFSLAAEWRFVQLWKITFESALLLYQIKFKSLSIVS